MGSRHEARQRAVQFLFQRDFNRDSDLRATLGEFWENQVPTSERIQSFAEQIIYGVEEHLEELDGLIRLYAQNWDISRIGAIERNAMRMALYEMLYRLEIPPVVSINEAIEIAKEFGDLEAAHFVNGILDRALQNLPRPARNADLQGSSGKSKDTGKLGRE